VSGSFLKTSIVILFLLLLLGPGVGAQEGVSSGGTDITNVQSGSEQNSCAAVEGFCFYMTEGSSIRPCIDNDSYIIWSEEWFSLVDKYGNPSSLFDHYNLPDSHFIQDIVRFRESNLFMIIAEYIPDEESDPYGSPGGCYILDVDNGTLSENYFSDLEISQYRVSDFDNSIWLSVENEDDDGGEQNRSDIYQITPPFNVVGTYSVNGYVDRLGPYDGNRAICIFYPEMTFYRFGDPVIAFLDFSTSDQIILDTEVLSNIQWIPEQGNLWMWETAPDSFNTVIRVSDDGSITTKEFQVERMALASFPLGDGHTFIIAEGNPFPWASLEEPFNIYTLDMDDNNCAAERILQEFEILQIVKLNGVKVKRARDFLLTPLHEIYFTNSYAGKVVIQTLEDIYILDETLEPILTIDNIENINNGREYISNVFYSGSIPILWGTTISEGNEYLGIYALDLSVPDPKCQTIASCEDEIPFDGNHFLRPIFDGESVYMDYYLGDHPVDITGHKVYQKLYFKVGDRYIERDILVHYESTESFNFPGMGFISTEGSTSFIIRKAVEDVTYAEIDTGLSSLKYEYGENNVNSGLQFGDEISVKINWPGLGQVEDDSIKGRVFLSINGVESEIQYLTQDGDEVKLDPDFVVCEGEYDVALCYEDDLGSYFEIRWPNVLITSPPGFLGLPSEFWESANTQTVIAWLVTLILAGLFGLLKIPILKPALKRWLPLVMYLISTGAIKLEDIKSSEFLQSIEWLQGLDWNINFPMYTGFIVGTAILLIPAGIISPRTFRNLADVIPYNIFAQYGIWVPYIRRHLFSDYANELERKIERAKKDANCESYVSIPARIYLEGDESGQLISDPAEFIFKFLASGDPGNSGNVYIESPGGRGKSAIVREVVRLAIERFRIDPKSPLPVMCDPSEDDFEDMIERALGKHKISDEVLELQLKSGDYILVVDGLSESDFKPEEIERFVRSVEGERTRVVISTRPSNEYRQAVMASESLAVVIPQRLVNENVDLFIETYSRTDRLEIDEGHLTKNLKDTCRGSDGTYLPILVRLAILAARENPESVSDIYEDAFNRLAKSTDEDKIDEDLIDDAAELCVDTYWKDGYRSLAFASMPVNRKKILQRLLDSGVVVSADEGSRMSRKSPKQVKFFHDSMQSYLTARGLLAKGDWTCLVRAAGEPMFRESETDRFTDQVPELFEMCLHVFKPTERLRDELRKQLIQWSREREGDLRKNDVINSVPAGLWDEFSGMVEISHSVEVVLKNATDICDSGDDLTAIHNLGILYSRIASMLYQDPAKTKAASA